MSSSKYIVTTCRMCAFKFIPDEGKKEPNLYNKVKLGCASEEEVQDGQRGFENGECRERGDRGTEGAARAAICLCKTTDRACNNLLAKSPSSSEFRFGDDGRCLMGGSLAFVMSLCRGNSKIPKLEKEDPTKGTCLVANRKRVGDFKEMVKYIDFVAPTVRCPGGKCLILSEEEVVLDKYGHIKTKVTKPIFTMGCGAFSPGDLKNKGNCVENRKKIPSEKYMLTKTCYCKNRKWCNNLWDHFKLDSCKAGSEKFKRTFCHGRLSGDNSPVPPDVPETTTESFDAAALCERVEGDGATIVMAAILLRISSLSQ